MQILAGYRDPNGNWVPVSSSNPLPISGGGGGDTVTSVNGATGAVTLDAADVNALPDTYTPPASTWASITGKPTTFAPITGTGATEAMPGNTALLSLGATATTAKPGNYQPTWAQVTAKPATVAAIPATLGTPGQILAVNAEGDGLEWIDPPA